MSQAMETARKCVLSVLGFDAVRVGGLEMFLRRLSMELARAGWRSVACFPRLPSGEAARYLSGPWLTVDSEPELFAHELQGRMAAFHRQIQRHRPGIVHLHFLDFISPFPWLAKLGGARRVFFADHRSRPEGFEAAAMGRIKRSIARLANYPISAVISVSDYGRRCQNAYRALPPRCLVAIRNSVDLDRVETYRGAGAAFRKSLGIPDDRVLATQVSWMVPEKGISDFIAAARRVAPANPNVHFALVGEGASMDRFQRETAEAGLANRFHFTGQIGDPFAAGVFDGSDIVCQLSRWEEAIGWVVLEAMAFGRPVVATRVGGIPEAVEHGVTGFLVERRDPDAVAAHILELAADAGLRRRMGARGRCAAYERFDLARNIREHLDLYGCSSPVQ